MQIVRKFLSASEVNPPNQRWDETCECIQTSPDGGVTWIDDPASDPRSNTAYQSPPNTESDPRCAAAAGMVELVRRQVDTAINFTDALSIANVIIGLALPFFPIAVFAALVIAIADALLVIGPTVISTSFDSTAYDDLLKLFYCNINDDGQITDAGMSAVIDQASVTIDTIVSSVLSLIYQPFGAVGWNNAAVAYADGSEDCSALSCTWSCHIDLTDNDGGFASTYGVWNSGVGWESANVGGTTELLVFDQSLASTHILSMWLHLVCVTNNDNCNGGFAEGAYGFSWTGKHMGDFDIGGDYDHVFTGMGVSAGNGGHGHFKITSMDFTGDGDNPFEAYCS